MQSDAFTAGADQDLGRRVAELERELSEAHQREAATAEVLKVISGSPTNVQPVFDAIVASAAELCEAGFSAVTRFDGELLHLVAVSNMSSGETEAYRSLFPRPPTRGYVIGRAFIDGVPAHVADVTIDPDYDPRTLQVLQRAAPYRTYLGIPIIRHGVAIGSIGCGRREVKPFTTAQIALVKTFADQAVIAIENTRLFEDVQESLQYQTATSEVLSIISSSPTTVQPVFDTIARTAFKLCAATFAMVFRFDGTLMHLSAHHNVTLEGLEALQRQWPMRLDHRSVPARAVLERRVIHVRDVLTEAANPYLSTSRALGIRTMLIVPMLREGEPIGAVAVYRRKSSLSLSSRSPWSRPSQTRL